MLPTLFTIMLILLVVALLPYIQPKVVVDDDEAEEPAKLRMKPTRQR